MAKIMKEISIMAKAAIKRKGGVWRNNGMAAAWRHGENQAGVANNG